MYVMRAKLKITEVNEHHYGQGGEKSSESLKFTAVYKDGAYPADGSDEDNTFARFTPQADLTMSINNPALFGKFEVGQKFYVDFSKADA